MLLYLHIPFCAKKCNYCNFNSYPGYRDYWELYLSKLIEEFDHLQQRRPSKFETVFIGGGTPSLLPAPFYCKLMEHLSPHLLPGAEKSIEANPNLSRRWLEEVAPLFNRISFGVQSFDERKLNFLGRIHTPTQARRAVEWAAEAGFRNINLDLIYGVAGDSWELLERDLNIALSLPITHISAYSLTIEEGTPFASHPNPKLEDEELELRFIEAVASHLPQYEISNFGWICRHNLGYWQLKEYRGIGAGAVGFERGVRYYHHLSVEEYCWNPLPVEEEKIGEEELRVEKVLLGFRSIVGVEGAILTPPQLEKGFKLVEEGLLRWEGGRFYNPNFAIADRLALELLEG